MAVERKKRVRIAFALDKDVLSEFASCLHAICQKVEFIIETSDGSTFKFTSLNKVMNLPNLPRSQIVSLKVKVPHYIREGEHEAFSNIIETDPQVSVDFKIPESFLPDTVWLNVSGSNEKDVNHYFGLLLNKVEIMKRPKIYSMLAFVPFRLDKYVIFGLTMPFLFFEAVLNDSGIVSKIFTDNPLTTFAILMLIIFTALYFIFVYLIVKLISKLQSFLYPIVEFKIGAGLKRHEQSAYRRKQVSTILIGVIATLLGTALLKQFGIV